MFNQTFVEAEQATKKSYAVALSVLIQLAVLTVLALAPLAYREILPAIQLKNLLLAPRPPIVAKHPSESHTAPAARSFHLTKWVGPLLIRAKPPTANEAQPAPDLGAATGLSQSSADSPGSDVLGLVPSTRAPAPPPPAPKTEPARAPVKLGGVVAEANLIHRVQPIYPPLAKSARVQGAVQFTAVISTNGTIEKLELLRGHPLLIKAAKEAILQWRYRPTLLNGHPTEVITEITVNFTLSQ